MIPSIVVTTIVGTVIGLVVLYATIWAVLFVMFSREQTRTISRFEAAFDGGEVKTSVTRHDMTSVLQLTWPDGNGLQRMKVDEDGKMLTPIEWSEGGRLVSLKISNRIRKRVEPKAMQVAAMHKLQHGTLRQQDDFNGAAMSQGNGF